MMQLQQNVQSVIKKSQCLSTTHTAYEEMGRLDIVHIVVNAEAMEVEKNWSRPVHSAIIAANTQNCRFCNIEKPLDAFYANGCFADGVKKYRSRCKQCVLLLSKQAYPKIYISKAIKRSSSPKNFISGILNHATKRKQHLIFDIDLMYLLQLYENQKGCCALSGVQMTYIAGNGKVNTNISIDRIDSSKGYSKGNVQFVCDIVNRMKQDLSEIDLLIWCKHIVKALK